ncbi:MAG: glycosyltransferase family 2 protein [Clostridium sp.]|nr:glycosyltransferase family 2 protein [Clostridium sp.]
MKKAAVIILNWNGEKLLREFLPQVMANTNLELADVIIADNGSADASIQTVGEIAPEAKILAFDKNYGFAGGYNRAIEATRYEYTVLLNSDAAPAAGWLETMLEYMEAHPETVAAQPKILSYAEKGKFEYAGACGGFLDRHGYPFCRGRIFSVCEEDRGQYDEPMEVFWATGAALMVRSEAYLRAGGLDEAFFAHMEEIDLCWRLMLAGGKIAAVPQAVVYHLGGGSLPASNPKKTYLNFRNSLLMLHKNLPDSTRGRKLLARRLLDTLAWTKFMAALDFKNAGAIWRAHRDFSKMRKAYSQHPAVDLLDEREDARVDILKAYYLGGKHRYSELKR